MNQQSWQWRDIIYAGLNVKLVIAYLAETKYKADNVTLKSDTDRRKYHDAILFGAKCQSVALSTEYHLHMKEFLDNYKKEYKKAKSDGNVEENAADAIPFTLYRKILQWSLSEKEGIFVWVWTILQWNLMARSISIDPLAFHNMSVGEDNIIILHDSTKSDKKGEKLVSKHCYAHPKDPLCCINTALGIWLHLNQPMLEKSELIFCHRGTKNGSASKKYCEKLIKLFDKHENEVGMYVKKASAHGLRKGSATAVSSSTTMCLPIAKPHIIYA